MKIVVTGGSGFVWSKIIEMLYRVWSHTIISCQRKKLSEKEGIIYKYFDHTTEVFREEIFTDIDVFIHCASCVDYTKSLRHMLKQNVDSLKAISYISANAKHFLYISSSSVYQWFSWEITTNSIIDEKNLRNSYSYSKYMAEKYIQEYFKNPIITILRPRAIYWEWDTTLVPQVLKNSVLWYLLLPWNWKTLTSVTNIDKFCHYIFYIIHQKIPGIHNFSTDIMSYEEIYLKIKKDYHKKWILHLPYSLLGFIWLFHRNKYSYLLDTFWNNKILINTNHSVDTINS